MSYAKPITIIVAGLICAHAASVSAHDLCFRYNNGGGTLVLKSPKIQLNVVHSPLRSLTLAHR